MFDLSEKNLSEEFDFGLRKVDQLSAKDCMINQFYLQGFKLVNQIFCTHNLVRF